MTIAIGGWVLLALAAGPCSDVIPITCAVRYGQIVRGYDTARECEADRKAGQVCVPALALVNR